MFKKYVITKQARENIITLWEILTTNYCLDISIEQLSNYLLRNVVITEIVECIEIDNNNY